MSQSPYNSQANTSQDNLTRTTTDRRADERIPVRDFCEMVMSGQNMSRICMVHNLTAFGAMIESSVTHVPDTFVLLDPSRGIRASCRVVWQKDSLIGVEFQKPIKL